MKIITTRREMQAWSHEHYCNRKTLGFVPTMGALHEGHLALMQRAHADNDFLVASIFVNPTQFGAGEDFSTYARPFERDCELLREIGCAVLFAPDIKGMYPHLDTSHTSSTRNSKNDVSRHHHEPQTVVEVLRLGEVWEGTVRPGHLRGVATVVSMLFNLVRPTRAYFGEKDYQQLKVVEHLVRDLCFDTQIVPCETTRESDGLALSSRNVNLDEAERRAAPALFRGMKAAVEATQNGERDAVRLGEIICAQITREPLITVQYIAIVDAETLQLLPVLNGSAARVLVAAKLGKTRLIDNMAIA